LDIFWNWGFEENKRPEERTEHKMKMKNYKWRITKIVARNGRIASFYR
jgi:hypothetical protein